MLKMPPNIDGFISTLNKMGYMVAHLDPFTKKFIEFSLNCLLPVADIGAAYGVASLEALKRGVNKVIANDIDPSHLQILFERTPVELRSRLKLRPGAFPHGVKFVPKSLDAILISRVLHFFKGPLIEESLAIAFEWLNWGGKLFVITESPYVGNAQGFIPIYEEKKAQGEKWPGFISDFSLFSPERSKNLPKSMHLLDPDVLSQALVKAGFEVEEACFFPRDDFPQDSRLDGREGVGLIARKPFL